MREDIKLECTECKRINYRYSKNKKTHPGRLEVKKYCAHCDKRTIHKESR